MHKREIRQLICSMLIGDGYINDNYLSIAHCIEQEDYLLWKAQLIDKIFEEKKLSKRCTIHNVETRYTKNKPYLVRRFTFSWKDYFKKFLRKRTYQFNSKKDSNKKYTKNIQYILREMTTDLHTAIWFADDGGQRASKQYNKNGSVYIRNPHLMLYTYEFTIGQANLAIQWFKQRYKVTPYIRMWKNNGEYRPVIKFSVADSRVLFPRIAPYLWQVPSMQKKFCTAFSRYYHEELNTLTNN